ncbi:MAG: response regulator [bacterium]
MEKDIKNIKKKILVVDDEVNSREGLSKILIKEGFEVVCAEDGSSAFEKILTTDFDIVITDLKMEGTGGIELLEKIKKEKPTISVILVTAYGEVNSYLKAMNLGAFEYLNKPIKIDELRHIINKALNAPEQ